MSVIPPCPVPSPFPLLLQEIPFGVSPGSGGNGIPVTLCAFKGVLRDDVPRVSLPLVRVAFLAALSGVHLNPSTDLGNVGFFFLYFCGAHVPFLETVFGPFEVGVYHRIPW